MNNKSYVIQRALISVSDKTGIVTFAKKLHDFGVELISTGGTARVLREAGLPVEDVSTLTGFPEMLDGRVKTLHPAIHGGILGVRDIPSHISAMEEHDIQAIDLICIDLYPFEETISRDSVAIEEAIEQIDIGGPAMIRSAAKNYKFVTVLTNPTQYSSVLLDLEANDCSVCESLRFTLATDAFARTASYDAAIYNWLQTRQEAIPSQIIFSNTLKQTLRYGENPNQPAALYVNAQYAGPSVVTAECVAGKPLSYNNLMDAAAALELVQELHEAIDKPTVAIIKHANPCGAAIGNSIEDAFIKAWECDPLASFGGIVSLSNSVDADLAVTITDGEKFLEVIVAPTFSDEAIAILTKRWKNIRLLSCGDSTRQITWNQIRSVPGGVITQEITSMCIDTSDWEHAAGPPPINAQIHDSIIAWITCSHLKSNAISIVDQGVLIGGGMGQVDRVSAAKLAIIRAANALETAISPVAGSDAFFPFSDGPALLINAGVKCIIQPGGSVRDQETIDLCNAHNVTLLHTGIRCFRH